MASYLQTAAVSAPWRWADDHGDDLGFVQARAGDVEHVGVLAICAGESADGDHADCIRGPLAGTVGLHVEADSRHGGCEVACGQLFPCVPLSVEAGARV